jgi:hypothetical protein
MSVSAPADPTCALSAVCFGESITSLRSLLKRYTMYQLTAAENLAAVREVMYTQTRPNFPLPRGYAPDGIHTGVGGPYNYVNQTVLGWLSPVFQGWRGGIRRKIICVTPSVAGGSLQQGMMQVRRIARPAVSVGATTQPLSVADNVTEIAKEVEKFPVGFSGMTATTIAQNPVLEVEMPYHSDYRFHPTRPLQPNANPAVQYENSHELKAYVQTNATTGGPAFVEYIAAGDDISMFFYTNVPVCYYFPTNPG